MARAKDIKLGLCRVGFAQNLFQARAAEEGASPKFGCTLLIPKSDTATLTALQGNIVEACVAASWGDSDKVLNMLKNGLIKNPVLDGDGPQGLNKKTGERHAGYEGHWFVRVSSGEDYAPQVLDENVQKIASFDPSRFKSGDYGYPVVSSFTWEHKSNGKGVTLGIGAIQRIKAGDALGGTGGVDTEKFFKPETVEGQAPPSETKQGAGAGGLFG